MLSMPPATAGLVAVNVGMFIQQAFAPRLTVDLALWPIGAAFLFVPEAGFAPYQVVTYGFLHGSFPLGLGTSSGVAHFAHLGGMLGGLALMRHWKLPPMPAEQPAPADAPGRLRD
jgi:membrane associated rhomboid family serine protease